MAVTSAVCLIAKNEGSYLLEWLAYYRVLGFDEIIIYENNSSDESSAILSKLAAAKKVVYRPWLLGRNESPQITAYADAIKRVKSDWILFVDADEFLVLHHHDTVNAFLASFQSRSEVTSIGVNWRIFGDSNLESQDPRPVIERFTHASLADFSVNMHLKSFSRVGSIGQLVHMHVCETTGQQVHPSGLPLTMPHWGLSERIELEVAQINHYYAKTFEEYQNKKRRGQGGAGDDNPELKYWYNDDSFRSHNRNDVEDLSALKQKEKIFNEIAELTDVINR